VKSKPKMSHEKFRKLPYLDVKVVKVEGKQPKVKTLILKRRAYKKVKEECISVKINDPKLYLYRHGNSQVGDEAVYPDRKIWKIIKIIEPKQPKGNWCNGENLDKIKFPCFCSYKNNQTKFFGEINSSFRMGHGQDYILSYIGEQGDTSRIERNKSLKNLIESHDIHILKGKFILFEEANE